MDIIIFLLGTVLGLLLNKFLPSYFSKKGENLATKEDIGKITKEIEEIKNIYRKNYDLSKAERDFYDKMIETLQSFLATIKKYELKTGKGKNSVTSETIRKDEFLMKKFVEFVDASNEILTRAFVFLNDKNYKRLYNALNKEKTFAEIRYNLLDAMRISLYSRTKLKAKKDTWDLKY